MEIYMQSLEKEVRSAINSIQNELIATGTDGPSPQPSSRTQQNNVREGEDSKVEAPSHAKILPFAGKLFGRGSAKCLKGIGGPDRDRTDDLFHAME
jgi:hypothetical protein